MKELLISGKRCRLYEEGNARDLLIQPAGEEETEFADAEVSAIRDLAPGHSFRLLLFPVEDWNRDLSPWEAPPVFGSMAFGNGAVKTLSWIEEELFPVLESARIPCDRVFLGGYSLAGLFALWAAYQTDRFSGVAAVSPSVWFPGWLETAERGCCLCPSVYLSLGDREEKTRNRTMATVGSAIRRQAELLSGTKESILEWNPGNHFNEPDVRMAKGFAWLLKRLQAEKKDAGE
ncbi:MAG: esterase [Oscillospiraceae bacterium]|nr:esterase [Oscillospiraceae bacterium]